MRLMTCLAICVCLYAQGATATDSGLPERSQDGGKGKGPMVNGNGGGGDGAGAVGVGDGASSAVGPGRNCPTRILMLFESSFSE
jgi:hypothetical protein